MVVDFSETNGDQISLVADFSETNGDQISRSRMFPRPTETKFFFVMDFSETNRDQSFLVTDFCDQWRSNFFDRRFFGD